MSNRRGGRLVAFGPFDNALQLLLALQRGEPISVPWIMENIGVGRAQAKRYLVALQRRLPLVRGRVGKRSVYRVDAPHAMVDGVRVPILKVETSFGREVGAGIIRLHDVINTGTAVKP